MTFADSMLLGDARAELRRLVDDGHQCPCCHQLAKVYPRTIHSTMARELIALWRTAGLDWCDPPCQRGGDLTKCRYWGLMEPHEGEREDGSNRNGLWRVTVRGAEFVQRRLTVPKYARVYDGRCLGLRGDQVSIVDCLGAKFDYRELMA